MTYIKIILSVIWGIFSLTQRKKNYAQKADKYWQLMFEKGKEILNVNRQMLDAGKAGNYSLRDDLYKQQLQLQGEHAALKEQYDHYQALSR